MITVPTDSPSVFDALNTLVLNGAQLAIVRPNNPPPGIAGFLFDLVDDDGAELESDITDHYVEDNTPVQDQIALRPEIVTVTGRVAELVRRTPAVARIADVTNPLPLVDGLEPTLSPGALAIQDAVAQAAADDNAAIASTQSLYGYYNSRLPQQPNQTKQSVIYGYVYQLWKGRQLFSVETPWGIFTNMAILSLSARQPAETRSVSEFNITFKKIRTVRSVIVTPGLLAGRATFQQAPITQNGTVGQVPFTPAKINQFLQRIAPPLSSRNPFAPAP